jgi:hypothetical protein
MEAGVCQTTRRRKSAIKRTVIVSKGLCQQAVVKAQHRLGALNVTHL